MRSLDALLKLDKKIRVIGFDDAPFSRERGSPVNIAGIVCNDIRFEGMLWASIEKDGTNATEVMIESIRNSKFYQQIHVILIDGIAVGGFNIIDIQTLSNELDRPCIAVMRRKPNFEAIDKGLKNFHDYELRKQRIINAGKVHSHLEFFYQVSGCSPRAAGEVLAKLTDTGNVPEALRLAHLIGAAIATGQSGKRA